MAASEHARRAVQRLRSDSIASESVWGLVFELVTLVGTILSFTLLGRTLGAAGYGGYASLYAIVGPLVTLASAGVVLAVLQHIVRDREPIAETARSCLTITILLGSALTVVGAGAAAFIIEGLTAIAILSILLTEFVTAPIVQVSASTVQAVTGFTDSVKLRLQLVIGRTVILVVLFASDALTVGSLGVAMLAFSAVLALRSLRQVGARYGFRFVPVRMHVRHLKTNGLYSAAISASALNNDGDKLVMAANRLVVDTGLYAAAYRVVSFGMIPITSLVAVSHRRFLEHEEGVRGQHLRRSLKFGAVGGGFGLLFGIGLFLGAPLLPLLMGDQFEGSVPMVRWLSPTVMLRALAMFSLNGLMGLNRVALRTVLIVINAVVAMALYIVLIPRYGWEGAAIGTLISELLVTTSTWWVLVACQRADDRALDTRLSVPS
jgi:O-antigen/teichoic acid export membrane protein